jgi:nitroimidazol reductase NimA-like FMN-containing flavoprotein (pyridoxamine 5'-phosphate oxidase superfamily)
VEGKDSQWRIKVTTDPDTDWNDWLSVVVQGTVFALDMAQNKEDVMTVWRTNANIYKIVEQRDSMAYPELTKTFKTYKESFDEQVSK